MKQSKPAVSPTKPAFQRQLFTWPGVPFCVLNSAPRHFLPMLRVNYNGAEHLMMLPEVPVFQTLDEATAYHQDQAQKAMADRAPKVWAPPGQGRFQA